MIGLKKLRGKTTKKEKDHLTDGPLTTRTAQAWRECQALSNNAPKSGVWPTSCRTRHRGGPKNALDCGKRTDIWHLVLLGEKVLFEESPPSIMVTRNPNWST